jgi:hypothetical protein
MMPKILFCVRSAPGRMKIRFPLGAVLAASLCLAIPLVQAEPPMAVPPPVPETHIALPALPPLANPVPPLSRAEIEKLTPQAEVWRDGSNTPQRPVRRQGRFDAVCVVGDHPVVVRLQFDRSASGKTIVMSGANNVTLQTADAALRVRPTGECVIALLLDPAALRGHIKFACEGVQTTMPLVRSTIQRAAAKENADNGGGR